MLCSHPDNLYRAREVNGVGGIVSHWVRAMCPSEMDVLMGPDPTLGRYLSARRNGHPKVGPLHGAYFECVSIVLPVKSKCTNFNA